MQNRMHFCVNCGRVMSRDTATGSVVYRCYCGTEEQGAPSDARVGGSVTGAGETTEMYRNLIVNAAQDRTNQIVRRPCPNCGRDYAVQIRVGETETIIYKCKCGAEQVGSKSVASVAATSIAATAATSIATGAATGAATAK